MKRDTQHVARMAAGALIILTGLSSAGADYALDWYTIDGGGEMLSTGGNYELSGTVGQPDAGQMSGGTYTLTSGFWFRQVPGDCDYDGDVDLDDFAGFAACLLGPGGGLGMDCNCFDLDGSGDVDLGDFAVFQEAFTG